MNKTMNGIGLGLEGIKKTFHQAGRSLEVLNGASLAIERGELVALVGPSGAGKSTLMHIAGLLEKPDAGSVEVAGGATQGLAESQRTILRRTKIGFVYQYHHLLPEFSALENLVVPMMINGQSKAKAKLRAAELLDGVGLTDRADHRPARLSGGEQQRVAIARALANEPAVLLADEPTGNLDPHTAEAVFALLIDLVRRKGVAALIATHNFDLAARMDRTLRLEEGQVLAS